METINYVLYDNPISQGCIGATKQILKPIANLANGNSAPQIQIIKETEPLWMMAKEPGPFVRIAGLSGALAVSLAAYGAHKKYPKDQINELKAVADSANKMHFFHSLALLAVPLCRNPRATGGLLITGTVLFSGPCYYYAFTGENKFGKLAPIGGTILILGWLSMVF